MEFEVQQTDPYRMLSCVYIDYTTKTTQWMELTDLRQLFLVNNENLEVIKRFTQCHGLHSQAHFSFPTRSAAKLPWITLNQRWKQIVFALLLTFRLKCVSATNLLSYCRRRFPSSNHMEWSHGILLFTYFRLELCGGRLSLSVGFRKGLGVVENDSCLVEWIGTTLAFGPRKSQREKKLQLSASWITNWNGKIRKPDEHQSATTQTS